MKQLKDLVCFGLCVGELVADIADGIGFSVIAKLVNVAKEVRPALSGVDSALEQYKNLTEEQALELKEFVVTEFDISQDKAEKVIEDVLSWVIDLSAIIGHLLPEEKKA